MPSSKSSTPNLIPIPDDQHQLGPSNMSSSNSSTQPPTAPTAENPVEAALTKISLQWDSVPPEKERLFESSRQGLVTYGVACGVAGRNAEAAKHNAEAAKYNAEAAMYNAETAKYNAEAAKYNARSSQCLAKMMKDVVSIAANLEPHQSAVIQEALRSGNLSTLVDMAGTSKNDDNTSATAAAATAAATAATQARQEPEEN